MPIFKLVYDRQKRASKTKEGSVELRITFNRVQRHVTTGVRVLPSQWKDGRVVKRVDALEVQRELDLFVASARKVVCELMERGELDMGSIVSVIGGRQRRSAVERVPDRVVLLDFFRERMAVRVHGRSRDSRDRYERFLRWFEQWGGMVTMGDVTELNIVRMDEALAARGMKAYSKWQNYHRFLNSFIIDAVDAGLLRRNPYRGVHICKEQSRGGIGKYLTREELGRLECLNPPTLFLRHALDLFVFQTYTCLSYVDMVGFDAGKVDELFGRMAEKPFEEFSEGERTLWQKIKATVRRLLDKFLGTLKLPKWFTLGDNELRYILWRSKERLERGKEHPIDLARDIVQREELGLTDEARYNMGEVSEPSFAARRDRAVKEHDYVHPGLNSAEVKVVSIKERTPFDTSKKTKALKEDVVAYANEHNIIGTMTEEETKGKGQISISKTSIEKMVDDSATSKSVDKDTHLAVIPQLREIIAESVMAETHPDYNKGEDGKRSPENGYNPDNLIHRCFGAISVDGQEYRVKLTLKETSGNRKSKKAYSYEVTKIEVLDGQTTKPLSVSSRKSNTPNGVGSHPQPKVGSSYPLANLLQNVEKSHDSGKKLLEQSEIADESADFDNPLTLDRSSELDGSRSTADLYRDPDETEDISPDGATSPSPQHNSRERGSAFGLDDIWNDQSLGLRERMTAAATRLANNHREDKTLLNDAMRAIGENLADLSKSMLGRPRKKDLTDAERRSIGSQVGKAARERMRFDVTTVKRVSDLARVLLSSGYIKNTTSGEIRRLLSAVKNSVGHDDIEDSVQDVMDIMVDNQLRHAEDTLRGLEAIRGSKVDARGVEVQGELDPAGQTMMEAFKEGRRLTREALEEEIGKELDRMSSESASVRERAENACGRQPDCRLFFPISPTWSFSALS